MNTYTIEDIDNEINAIHSILKSSIDAYYGVGNGGKKLSTEEHFAFWDRMWELSLLKKTMTD